MACKSFQQRENPEEEYGEEDSDSEEFQIITLQNGKLRTNLDIPWYRYFFPQMIGKNGATKKNVEEETGTRIFFPGRGEPGNVCIIGPDKKSLCSARSILHSIALAAKDKAMQKDIRPTHFLLIPLVNPTFEERFTKFKASVLERCPDRGIREVMFKTGDTLHLTLSVMPLVSVKEQAAATAALAKCKDEIITPHLKGEPLRLRLRGLEVMNGDDPSRTRVLFVKVFAASDEERFRKLLEKIVDFFCNEGLINKRRDSRGFGVFRSGLRATLMHWTFGLNEEGGKAETFDTRNILKYFEDFDFGEGTVTGFEINELYSAAKTGQYKTLARISVP